MKLFKKKKLSWWDKEFIRIKNDYETVVDVIIVGFIIAPIVIIYDFIRKK